MKTREQAQWVLALLLAGRRNYRICVVSQIVHPTRQREFATWNLATDALQQSGFYATDGTRADMAAIRRAIRSLDEATR